MYLVVVEDEDGAWKSEPECVASYAAAKDAMARKADGSVPSLVAVVYEMKQVAATTGRME
jgi:hypothetical protein